MMLPKPLSLEEIQAHIPSIGPVPEGIHRPFWSVMIPTYNNGKYLRRTLESVLCQAPDPDEMQIEVIERIARQQTIRSRCPRIGQGTGGVLRQPSNLDQRGTSTPASSAHMGVGSTSFTATTWFCRAVMRLASRRSLPILNARWSSVRSCSYQKHDCWLGVSAHFRRTASHSSWMISRSGKR